MRINFILRILVFKNEFNHLMSALDKFVNEMTGGSLIYGMLMNNLNPEKLFFKDSSPFDIIDTGRKPKKLKLPIPEKITLSIQPKLQTKAFLRQYGKRKRIGRHSLDFASTCTAATPLRDLQESPMTHNRIYSMTHQSPNKIRRRNRIEFSPISMVRPETRAGNHARSVLSRRNKPPPQRHSLDFQDVMSISKRRGVIS